MNMTVKTTNRLPLAIFFLVVAVLGLGLMRSKYQFFKTQQAEDQRIQEVKELTQASSENPKYRDHTSQSAK